MELEEKENIICKTEDNDNINMNETGEFKFFSDSKEIKKSKNYSDNRV